MKTYTIAKHSGALTEVAFTSDETDAEIILDAFNSRDGGYVLEDCGSVDILRELARAWNVAKNAGLIAGEYYSVEDMQYEHDEFHAPEGGEGMTMEQARAAVRWLNRVDEVAGLFDRDMISEAIEEGLQDD